jgi:PqqA peptide cyclase
MTHAAPDTLVAELTHACPLACAYCSNPTAPDRATMSTAAWIDAIGESARLGVLQLHLTGGEPLLRDDLEALIAAARRAELYTNLITGGFPLTRERLRELRDAGLEHVQLSIQSADDRRADAIAHRTVAAHKREVATWVKAFGLPLTVNVVLHRENVGEVDALVALAESMGADRLELAPAQYLGRAFAHRNLLLPSRTGWADAQARALLHHDRLRGRVEVVFVHADYHAGLPRACMGGWGRKYLVISPDGMVLPCHAAKVIEGLRFPRVGEQSLDEIWNRSAGFQAYRGTGWMTGACVGCERQTIDFGGCRCQAFLLTGRADAPDPACSRSADHPRVARHLQVLR